MNYRKRLFIKTFPRVFPLLLVLWVLLVLYPNPLNLLASIWRAVDPATNPQAVTALAAGMPEDPIDIEPAVLEAIFYRYDWEIHGMPWYFPTVEEVIEKGQGDCKARALVMASVLESKDIPHTIRFSPIHIWVEYEGKESTSIENSGASFYELDPETGEKSLRLPSISLREVARTSWEGFWPPMPLVRKTLLVGGVSLLTLLLMVSLRVR